jgi:hypothetical protein
MSYQGSVGSQQCSESFRYGDSRLFVLTDAHSFLGSVIHREPEYAVSLTESIYNSIGCDIVA